MKTLKDFSLSQKRVLVRCDFNVPLDKKGDILDDFRIKETIPTIKYLIENNAKVILMSHLGRPEGAVQEYLRLDPIQARLAEHLDVSVAKAQDCVGRAVQDLIENMAPGGILLLENLRFHKEEEENDDVFAKDLASLADIYINDAFGVSHRAHASTAGITKFLPSGSGFLLEKEIKSLTSFMENPARPVISIIGGAKVETKVKLIDKIAGIVDFVLIGGLVSKAILGGEIPLTCPKKVIHPIDEIGQGKDIGPETIKIFKQKIASAKTIFFNGALGLVENPEFSKGTEEILNAIVESKAFSILGGGDMTRVIVKLGLVDKINHISTGGGAMLAFLSKEEMPGILALENNYENKEY